MERFLYYLGHSINVPMHVVFMAVTGGLRLAEMEQSKAAKLAECLEQGGERLNDEAIGLRKPYANKIL